MPTASLTDHAASLRHDPTFTEADFTRIAAIMREIAGITLSESNASLVVSRLGKHVKRLGFNAFSPYVELVESGKREEELNILVSSLTTNTTRFFREGYHFETLEKDLMPRLVARARSGGRVRLWSAGCSSGEEAYSIAAVVHRAFPDAAETDFKILATDICNDALDRAEQGTYPALQSDHVPAEFAGLIFTADSSSDDRLKINPALKRLISFRYLNFMEPWPVSGPFDAIFCRNVAIYMDDAVQSRIWAGLIEVLDPEGRLFIGHSERLGPEFKNRMQLCGKTTFKPISQPGSDPEAEKGKH